MRYLCIDPGTKRVGLAVGSDATDVVTPLPNISTENLNERMRLIAVAINKHGPDELVVGLPLNMDGSEGEAAGLARGLQGFLEQRHGIRTNLFDERLTSFSADEKMKGADLTRGQKKARRDGLAAAAILGDFLAWKKTIKKPE
jgi:putative Holliday junction resolvase